MRKKLALTVVILVSLSLLLFLQYNQFNKEPSSVENSLNVRDPYTTEDIFVSRVEGLWVMGRVMDYYLDNKEVYLTLDTKGRKNTFLLGSVDQSKIAVGELRSDKGHFDIPYKIDSFNTHSLSNVLEMLGTDLPIGVLIKIENPSNAGNCKNDNCEYFLNKLDSLLENNKKLEVDLKDNGIPSSHSEFFGPVTQIIL